uniref:Major facilitator superfamily (MFS) profile domain-containing protein n=1 Tax=Ditylenchus dipsaci TaxID=166011 RepID=A0A915CXR1_9BILA
MASEECGGRKPIGWKPVALDGGYGWVVVLGSFLIHVFADGFVYSFGVIAESLIKEFNASNAEVSTILSLLTGLMLATGPLASAICNRIGCRITTIVGAIIASIGCALSYYAYSMTYLILSVGIVMGTGFGLMYCPAIVIVTMYFEKYRALATGVTVCGAGVGTFLFSKIIGHLIVAFDWRTVFIIYAGMVLLCVPCGALYRPIQFEPIYDEKDPIEKFRQETEEKQALLAKPQSNGITSLQAGRKKLTSVNATHAEPIPEAEERSSDEDLTLNATSRPITLSVTLSKGEEGSPEAGEQHACIRPALSQACVDCSKDGETAKAENSAGGNGVLQRFLSLGEHLHTRAADGEKISISTGYLNIKDVFYHGSITALPEYNQTRFRSVSSLQSQKEGGSGVGGKVISKSRQELVPQKIDEKEEEDEDKEENSAATSASRAIDIWR